MKIDLLDHGFISLVGSLGNDLTVVNSARVSFGKQKEELSKGDIKLINYLASHKHFSPFRHLQLQFHIKSPEFLMRQFYKHQVGMDWTSDGRFSDLPWNEISGRYVDLSEVDFYIPKEFRKQSENNKQCSTDETFSPLIEIDGDTQLLNASQHLTSSVDYAKKVYKELVASGVSKEQARLVLPLNFYTEVYMTCSLEAAWNFIKLRSHEGAQWEARLYANAMRELVEQVAPHSLAALEAADNA